MSYKLRLFVFLSLILTAIFSFAADKPKPADIVAKHLDAIGPATARQALKGWQISGGVSTKVIVGGSGLLEGSARLTSDGPKNSTVMTFENTNYRGEEFAFDGNKVNIGFIRPGVRSRLGTFLDSQSQIVREGLLGGVLSTAWPLLDPNVKQAKLSSDGLKKIDGRQLYQLGYSPKKGGGDTTIKLYFDPETYRHVMTVYTMVNPVRLGSDQAENARQTESRIRLEEHFDDFKDTNGLMMPTKWSLKLTSEGGGSSTSGGSGDSIVVWDLVLGNFQENPPQAPAAGK